MEIDNNKIAMSLLLQCAWVWEHCMKSVSNESNEGEFKFSEVMKGFGRNANKSMVGYLFVEPELCQYWHVFNKTQPIEGLTFDRDSMMALLEFGSFKCSYPIAGVFGVTRAFCQGNGCSSLMNKTVFGCKGEERWAILPEVKEVRSKKSEVRGKKSKAKNLKPKTCKPETLSLADRLRMALQGRLAA